MVGIQELICYIAPWERVFVSEVTDSGSLCGRARVQGAIWRRLGWLELSIVVRSWQIQAVRIVLCITSVGLEEFTLLE